MDTNKKLNTGDHVIYFDEMRVPHDALVETWWLSGFTTIAEFKANLGSDTMPCVNLVYIDSDPSHRDQYGGQKQHKGSCIHGDRQTPPRLGGYWLFADEVS